MKPFNFGIEYKMYGTKTVMVPDDFTQEQAEHYVLDHWSEVDLPRNAEYIPDSDVPDFENSDFDERVWIVVNNYRDGIDYTVHKTREQAEKKFLDIVKNLGEALNAKEILEENTDGFMELASIGEYYAPNGDIIEIVAADMEV